MVDTIPQRMEFALEVAYQAGKSTLSRFQTGLEPDWKADQSPVTEADRESEQKIRKMIGRAYPKDGIVGEEFDDVESSSGCSWIVDPIDGTKSFVHGVPLYGVLLAFEDPEGVQVGVVHMPALGEMVWVAKGEGCWWNGRRARVSNVSELSQACLCYTESTAFTEQGCGHRWERLATSARIVRGWGDCYGHILVATGRADASFDPVMSPWDCGPLLPILEEAGGTFTDWEGTATIYGKNAVSTNGHLYKEVTDHLR